uniref:Uncharacterized protein n=1 Tax=Ciona savignyi TaxID=51511 RepID=H2YZH0_CIOSA
MLVLLFITETALYFTELFIMNSTLKIMLYLLLWHYFCTFLVLKVSVIRGFCSN